MKSLKLTTSKFRNFVSSKHLHLRPPRPFRPERPPPKKGRLEFKLALRMDLLTVFDFKDLFSDLSLWSSLTLWKENK